MLWASFITCDVTLSSRLSTPASVCIASLNFLHLFGPCSFSVSRKARELNSIEISSRMSAKWYQSSISATCSFRIFSASSVVLNW